MKNEKDVNYTIYEFSIAMQIWAYEAVPELDKRFSQRVVNDCPGFCASPLPNNRNI
ncbi:Hypothetical predicted protein, partial [Olea europaea subsp. europaea]